MTMKLKVILITAIILMVAYTPKLSLAETTGILLADDHGTRLYEKNTDHFFIPASITKILTSLGALKNLGPDYRFKTQAGYDPSTADLYIKGLGDPLFVSEQIRKLTLKLIRKIGNGPIRNIVLDHRFFSSDIIIPGTGESSNPYDATTGALCANFNTLFFKWDPQKNKFVSAEPQTPLLDIFQAQIKKSGQTRGRILLSDKQRRLYPGLLIMHFLRNNGVQIKGSVKEGILPSSAPVLVSFQSDFTLNQVIEKLLKFSNNFMANQLMLTMGAENYGWPATLEKGVTSLKDFAEKKLNLTNFILMEGSGLSRQNRLSPNQMLKVLMAFKPYHNLMRKQGNEFYKTGTLSDVRTRAGYIKGKDNRLYPFVIMINQSARGYADIRQKLKQIVLSVSQ